MKRRIVCIIMVIVMCITILSQFSFDALGASAESWLWPVEDCRIISSNFGWRDLYGSGYYDDMHRGIDISDGRGDLPVRASKSGTVITSINTCAHDNNDAICSCNGSAGNYIVIKHEDGTYSRYLHLRATGMHALGSVAQGETIGYIGSSGQSYGYHLHFDMCTDINNRNSTMLNPMPTNSEITIYNSYSLPDGWPSTKTTYVFETCEHTYIGEGICSQCGYVFPWENTKDNSYIGTYTVTLSGGTYPRPNAPYSDSEKSSTFFPKGAKINVSYGVTNAYENLWYYATYNGVSGFVNSDNVTLDSRPTQQFTCLISSPAEGAVVPKRAYPVIGTLTSAYYQIRDVKAYIDGNCYATVSNVNATTLELRPTAINQDLDFAGLSSGKHVLRIDARDSQSSAFVTVINRTFYTETADQEHSCNKGEYVFYEAAHPHLDCYKCSICGEIWRDNTSPKELSSCDACSDPNPIYISPGVYTIHSARNDNYVVDILHDSMESGANIQLYQELNNDVQKFRVVEYGDYYLIQSVYSGLWLDVAYPYYVSRSNVQLYNSYENNEEKWFFEDAGSGYVYIRNYYGNFLDIAGDSAENGANVQVYDTKESDSQRWKLILVEDESHKHQYSYETTTEATCTTNGVKTYTCSCGDNYIETIWAYGHSYINNFCSVCGAEMPEEPSGSLKEPEEPTEPSEKPTEKPVEPTEPSEKPAEKPVEPTEPEEKPEPVIPTENPFKDVKKSDYFCDPVLWAVGKGITNGMSATSFAPNANCTRGQIVTFLWRACGSPEPAKKDNPFKDVKSNEYYYKAVLWAVENGITTGLSKTSFGPNATCTRGQVATFLWRSQGEPAPKSTNNPFKDVKSSDYYFKAVLWAVENEVTQGMGGGKFAPNASCTRGQIVTFLFRAIA